ncbi:MAG TPA: hypothetical protein VM661_03210, partial [Candidatus Sulfotelmatobacter sp.]|nr:hypothetical protein [Candidatus Sulfotelmatobacter sp.]
ALPKPLTGWLAINDLGLPRFWATVWADILLCGVAETTRGGHLAAVEKLYRSAADQTNGDRLDAIIAALDFDELEAILGGFLSTLRNESAIEGIDREQTWQTALRFVSDVVNHIGRSDGSAFATVQARLMRLNVLYGQVIRFQKRCVLRGYKPIYFIRFGLFCRIGLLSSALCRRWLLGALCNSGLISCAILSVQHQNDGVII